MTNAQLLVQSKWLDEYNALFNNTNTKKLTISLLRKLCENLLINNNSDSRHLHVVYCNAANKVKELLACSEAVELKAQNCLKEGFVVEVRAVVVSVVMVLGGWCCVMVVVRVFAWSKQLKIQYIGIKVVFF